MIFFIIFPLFFRKCSSKPSYAKSIFGHPGTDEVENEWIDGIEIVERNLPIPARNHIKDAMFSDEVIPDDCYPYINHNSNLSYWQHLRNETNAVRSFYKDKIDLTQDDLYWHPAAAQNYYTTQEELDKADRVKIRFTVQPRYTRHVIPAFIPPGELVTVEIPEAVIGQISLTLNPQCKSFDGETPRTQQRLPNLQITFSLKNTINTIGSPYGGPCSVHVTTSDPIDITFSGVILQPYFYYGMTSDEEWENDLSKRPGPFAYFDTGNLVSLAPANQVRTSFRLNDCMKYWRSSLQISQTTALDFANYKNSRYGRIHNPCIVYYDIFVPYGEACSYTTTNHIQAPPYWVPQSITFDSCVDNPWGITHEINHQHQYDWAKTQSSTEMSNNAINLVTFSKTNIASSTRATSGWPRYTYASFMLNDQDNYGLSRYSTMLHFFGVERFKKFVASDQLDLYYSKNVYGVPGSEMLKASIAMNRSMRYHWNFHHTTDEVLNGGEGDTLGELEKLNLKPFHPVTTVYAVGIVVDGIDVITARPYRILPFEQTIDFVSTMVQRQDKEKFGDFEYQSAVFEEGRESAWKEKSKGVFTLTPKDNITATEEVRVNYLDKTTNEIHTVICQFTSMYSNSGRAKYTRYGYIPNTENDIFKAYRYISEKGNESNIISVEYTEKGIASPDYTNSQINTWISVLEGMIKPPENGEYVFSATADIQGLFYLSEEPLQGHPDLDADKLINFQDGTQMSFANANKSRPMQLDSSTYYYFRHIVFPNRGGDRKGRGWVGYLKDGKGDWDTVPKTWMRLFKVSDEELFKHQFVPKFERIYEMDVWDGIQIIKNPAKKWNVYKFPKGGTFTNSNNGQGTASSMSVAQSFTDSNDYTEFKVNWWPSNIAVAYPHIFEIDMGEQQSFDVLKLKGSGNNGWFGMNTYFKLYVAPYNYSATEVAYSSDNYSINHNESLIWEGYFDTAKQTYIDFDNPISGRYMKLLFINNSQKWKDGNPGRTDIAALEVGFRINNKKIYPMTNRRYITLTNRWDEYRGGAYYNGKGFTGYAAGAAPAKEGDNTNTANSIMSIRIPKLKPEFGIIGDFYPEMGTAIVKMDGKQVGIIGPNNQVDEKDNERKLSKAKRSYKSILYYTRDLDASKQHTCTVEVTEGQVTFSALLTHQMIVTYFTDDYRYPRILETEFDEDPEQYPWDISTDEFLHPAATPMPSLTPLPTLTPVETPTPSETPMATNTPLPTYTPPDYLELTMAQATGNYAQGSSYLKNQKVPDSSFATYDYSGEKEQKPITNAFDDKKDTYWVSSKNNTDTFKNYLTMTFDTVQCLEAILLDPAYASDYKAEPNTRRYDGFPLILTVYISTNNEPFRKHAVFTGPPKKTDIWDRVIFAFPDPIWCDKIKIEFTEITLDIFFGNDYTVAAGDIIYVKSQTLIATNSPIPSPIATPLDLTAAPTEQPTETPRPSVIVLNYDNLTTIEAHDKYVQSSTYVDEYKVPMTSIKYEASSEREEQPLSNIFDGNKNTFWAPSKPNTDTYKNYILVNFSTETKIEAILLDPTFSTNYTDGTTTRSYPGFPTKFKVYLSLHGEEFRLHSVFNGGPGPTDFWDRAQLVFLNPIWCDKLKLVFDEVTRNSDYDNEYIPALSELTFVSTTIIPSPSQSPASHEELLMIEAKDDYAQQSQYVADHQIPTDLFIYEHSGNKIQYPVTNAFDNNKSTYWVTSKENTETFKNYLTLTFSSEQLIEAILFDSAYSTDKNTNTRRYDGFPKVFKIYTSTGNEELKLHSIFSGAPESKDIWDRVKLGFPTPIICTKIKLEFDEVTLDKIFGNDYSVAVGNFIFVSPLSFAETETPTTIVSLSQETTTTPTTVITPPQETPTTPTPVETTPTDIVFEESFFNGSRFEKIVENFEAIAITIKIASFSGIKHPLNGGAINVVNAGLICLQAEFIDCTSNEAGGGIYLSYNYDYKNSYTLDDLKFKHCTAQYGGAVYVYSVSKKNNVMISNCIFENNGALRTEYSDEYDDRFGGSAIFMSVKTGRMRANRFIDNDGESIVKVVNHFPDSQQLKTLNHESFLLSNCEFENSKNSKGWIYYLLGNSDSSFEIRDCTFHGDLKDGEHYINGKSINKDGPKLIIKKCKFAHDSTRALNLDPSYVLIDLNDQLFNYSKDMNDHKSLDSWKTIISIAVPVVAIAIIIFIAIFITKRKKKNVNEECEMSAQTYIIHENDNELNAPLI